MLIAILLACMACEPEVVYVQGMKPTYTPYAALADYKQLGPQPIENSGKIVLYNSLLFMVENNRGVHIIDMVDTANPVKIWFLLIPANKDISIQNNKLYADNGPDLLVLDISNINDVKIVNRLKDTFKPSDFSPVAYQGLFECADYSKGWVTGWEMAEVTNPECRIE